MTQDGFPDQQAENQSASSRDQRAIEHGAIATQQELTSMANADEMSSDPKPVEPSAPSVATAYPSLSFNSSVPRNPSRASGLFSGRLGVVFGLTIGLVLGVGIIPRFTGSTQPTNAETTQDTAPAVSSVSAQAVTIATAEQAQIRRTLEATGTVVASDLLPILAKASGLQIQRVLVDEGDRITAGQTLAILDQSVLQTQIVGAEADLQAAEATVVQRRAALAQTKARLAEAEANLARYDDLSSQGAVSQQEFDTRATTAATAQEDVRVAEANISSALADVRSEEARIQQLKTQLGQAVVTAPASGIVAERFARVGDVTSGSQALFTVIRDRLLELDVDVPETQLPAVRIGSSVAISSDADPQLQLQGQVREILPLIDPETRQAIVKIDLPDSPQLRPGMFLRANLTTNVAQGITIPAKAILPQADGSALVYQLGNDNQVQAVTVEIGELLDGETSNAARIEVRQGLQVGDRVVVEGAGYLKDGDRVNVVQN